MEDMDRDVVVFNDDDGNEITLDVLDYFDYDGEEYALLADLSGEAEDDEDAAEQDVYIMKIERDGDYENFVPADEDKMEELVKIAEELLSADDDECDCGEGCDCHHHEGCGCHHEE